jgi:hypothetical protein
VGLIVATGSVGHHVHARADEVNTFLSRDGGLTWGEVAKGSHIYEFGDHGALTVMADNTQQTKRILYARRIPPTPPPDCARYSWNEGLNWTSFTFWNHHVEVENIITHPSGAAQVFLLYGRRNGKGVIMQLDFSTVHKRQCRGGGGVCARGG